MGRTTLFVVCALLHLYAGARLVPALADSLWLAALLGLLLAASAVLMPLALLGRRETSSDRRILVAWLGMLAMGWFSSLFVLTVMRDVLLLGIAGFDAMGHAGVPSHWIAVVSARAVCAGAFAATVIGAWNARRTATVVRVEVPIRDLPAALQGFRIAQISDIHVGSTIRAGYVQAIVRRVNGLQVDMVAVTGDLVDGSVADLAEHVAPLSGLASRHGTFFVTGNHEYYSGVHAWIVELRRLRMHVLLNEHVVLSHNGSPLVIAGVTDPGAHHFDARHRSDPQGALVGAPEGAPTRVLLAHQPQTAPLAADAGYQLQLSGHTHGGQFWPWNLLVRYHHPFASGLHRLKDLWIYTSRGTGYWGPPKRLGAPSEITHLRLIRA